MRVGGRCWRGEATLQREALNRCGACERARARTHVGARELCTLWAHLQLPSRSAGHRLRGLLLRVLLGAPLLSPMASSPVDQLVAEFLRKRGLAKTLKAFVAEARYVGFSRASFVRGILGWCAGCFRCGGVQGVLVGRCERVCSLFLCTGWCVSRDFSFWGTIKVFIYPPEADTLECGFRTVDLVGSCSADDLLPAEFSSGWS